MNSTRPLLPPVVAWALVITCTMAALLFVIGSAEKEKPPARGRPLPDIQPDNTTRSLVPESARSKPAPFSETALADEALTPEMYLLLYQDRAQTVQPGETFKLSDGTELAIAGQPVSFRALEGKLLAYHYDPPPSATGKRSPASFSIPTADIRVLDGLSPGRVMGDATIDRYVIHVLGGSLHECRYVAEEQIE